MRGGPPLSSLRHGCRVPGSGSGACPGGSAYPSTMPNAGVVPSQPLSDTLSYDDQNPWWPENPEAGFSNSNDGLDPSEYSNIWSSLGDPLSSNGFQQLRSIFPGHPTLLLERALDDADGDLGRAIDIVLNELQEQGQRQYQERLQQGKQLSEIPQAAGGENFQDFPTGMIQGLEGYGLEVFNPQPSIRSTKEKKAFPQTPSLVLYSTNLPSSASVPSSSFHQGRCFAASIPPPALPSKAFSSTPDGTLELNISPNHRLTQAFSAGAESHLGPRHVASTRRPEVICAHGELKVPARSRKGCWCVSFSSFLFEILTNWCIA